MLDQESNLKNQTYDAKIKSEFRERCYVFSLAVIRIVRTLPGDRVSWILSDQLLRSATSVGANIVEAKSASSKRDYLKYYEIALKSANETKYWLGLVRDALDVEKAEINKLLREMAEIANILAASILTMKGKRKI